GCLPSSCTRMLHRPWGSSAWMWRTWAWTSLQSWGTRTENTPMIAGLGKVSPGELEETS
ncbi:SCLY isoform 9, partial [Pongo abelii]